jgi:hypothetical protein
MRGEYRECNFESFSPFLQSEKEITPKINKNKMIIDKAHNNHSRAYISHAFLILAQHYRYNFSKKHAFPLLPIPQ